MNALGSVEAYGQDAPLLLAGDGIDVFDELRPVRCSGRWIRLASASPSLEEPRDADHRERIELAVFEQ